jgi:Spy/CpxP family protein refolding chaperone
VFVRPYLSILALLGALLGATVAAHAQSYPLPTAPPAAGAQGPGAAGATHGHRARLRMVLRRLNLTPAERSAIRSFVQSFRASRGTANAITRRQLLAQIEGVLTPDQRARFEVGMRAQRRLPQATPQSS